MNTARARGNFSLKERIEFINKYKKSNLTKVKFCFNNNIAISTLTRWLREFAAKETNEIPGEFIPVKKQETISLTIKINNNIELLIPPADLEYISAIIKMLIKC